MNLAAAVTGSATAANFRKEPQIVLVLSRRRNERIWIDGGIVVTVLDIKAGSVRLGIEAPTNVEVHRYPQSTKKRNGRTKTQDDGEAA